MNAIVFPSGDIAVLRSQSALFDCENVRLAHRMRVKNIVNFFIENSAN